MISFEILYLHDKIIVVQRKVDYILVGQGIAGTWLAFELLNRGHEILVLNHETENTASIKAAGIFNPITGRKMVKTWMADQLFSSLADRYKAIEKLVGEKFLNQLPIYRPFQTIEDKNDWDAKADNEEYRNYIDQVQSTSMGYTDVLDKLGGLIIKNAGYVNLPLLISSFRKYLISKGIYLAEMFDYHKVSFDDGVQYGEVKAKKIIFCEGPNANPYWNELPFKLVRGELIDIECQLETKHILNRGVFMIPKDGYFTVGSTYDHNNLVFEPQPESVENLKQRMSKLFSGDYRVLDQRAGVRPATFDRKPFIGLHPKFETLGIFNGFGTKGVSLTPYFASHFVDFLENKKTIDREVDVQRVY